jgi:cyclophilin family peptidyl-prolyl cis-trans isomerase
VSKAAKRERQRLNRESRREYEQTLERRRRAGRTARVAIPAVLLVVAVGVFFSISNSDDKPSSVGGCREVSTPKPKDTTFPEAPPQTIDPALTYVARVDTSCGSFSIALNQAQAPQTVNSFVFLAQQGFYDGLTFHRVAKDFVVQGGDPKGDGTGGPGYTIPDEPPTEGYQQGSVAMANSGPGTSGSQFFVVTTEEGAAGLGGPPFLYSILGQVTEGFETVLKMDKLGSTAQDPGAQKPKIVIRINTITIEQIDPTATTLPPTSTPPAS